MKILLAVLLLVSTSAAFGQAKFSGEYLGTAAPTRWTTNASERAVVDLYFYPDGYAQAQIWDYEFNLVTTASGTIDRAGRFSLLLETGFILKGTVSGGVARGSSTGNGSKYTFAVGRRTKLPYDPANPPVF
jgi:hypothetical protein